jgi:hypothetical protein
MRLERKQMLVTAAETLGRSASSVQAESSFREMSPRWMTSVDIAPSAAITFLNAESSPPLQ